MTWWPEWYLRSGAAELLDLAELERRGRDREGKERCREYLRKVRAINLALGAFRLP